MKELIEVNKTHLNHLEKDTVSAKELYLGLGLDKSQWARWSKDSIKNNIWFLKGEDWVGFDIMSNGNETVDFAISIGFAKHIAMQARTEKSHEYRNYMIEIENKAKSMTDLEMLLVNAQAAVKHEREINELQYQQKETTAQLSAIVDGENYFTVVGYANVMGEKVDSKLASNIGKKATKLCIDEGWHIGTAPHPVYGECNTYPKEALVKSFYSKEA